MGSGNGATSGSIMTDSSGKNNDARYLLAFVIIAGILILAVIGLLIFQTMTANKAGGLTAAEVIAHSIQLLIACILFMGLLPAGLFFFSFRAAQRYEERTENKISKLEMGLPKTVEEAVTKFSEKQAEVIDQQVTKIVGTLVDRDFLEAYAALHVAIEKVRLSVHSTIAERIEGIWGAHDDSEKELWGETLSEQSLLHRANLAFWQICSNRPDEEKDGLNVMKHLMERHIGSKSKLKNFIKMIRDQKKLTAKRRELFDEILSL